MEDPKLQKKLLQFIQDFNDRKLEVTDIDGKTEGIEPYKEGIGHRNYIGIWIELWSKKKRINKDDLEENLRLLDEDGKIKAKPKGSSYLDTDAPIFLTSKGFSELSIFKKYPLVTSLGVAAAIATIIQTIITIWDHLFC